MRTRPAAVTLTLLAIMFAVTGCGSSSSSTNSTGTTQASTTGQASTPAVSVPASLSASIEAICSERNHAIGALAATLETQPEIKRAAQKHANVERKTLAKLEKLTAPISMQPDWNESISYRRTLIKALDTLAEDGYTSRSGNALQTSLRAEEKILATAKRDGLKECAQPGYENLSR